MAPIFHIADLMALSAGQAVGLLFLAGASYTVMRMVYNVWFHPLSKIPGPKLWAATELFHGHSFCNGAHAYTVKELHDRYGPMVRVAPNYVSFNTPSSWKDIYGHVGSRKQFLKSDFYAAGPEMNIASQRDPHIHGKQRRLLSNSFSAKALAEQEDIVHLYTDSLTKQLGKYTTGPSGGNLVEWYNWTTFDVIGDMAFGEPFGSLKNAEAHQWLKIVFQSIIASTMFSAYRKWLPKGRLLNLVVPKKALEASATNSQYAVDIIKKRMNLKTARKDLLHKLIQEKDAAGLTIKDLADNSSVLIVAGSETTATTMSGLTYYLCKTPHAYRKLAEEIRGAFTSYDQIDHHNTEPLPYLKACLNEALRIYPPVPFGLPRDSPGETVDGVYMPVGTEVFTTSWASTHSTDNFHRPYDFLPERWLDADCKDRFDASQPFSLGSRVCLGRSLALMEMRIMAAKVLWAYDIELIDNELDWVRDNKLYSLWEKPELKCRLSLREGIELPDRANPSVPIAL